MTIIETELSWVKSTPRGPKGTGSLAADMVARLKSDGLLPLGVKLSANEAFPLMCFFRDLNATLGGFTESDRADPMTEAPIDRNGCIAQHVKRTATVRRVEQALSKLHQHERAILFWLHNAANRREISLNQAGHDWAPFSAQHEDAAANVPLGLLKGVCRSLGEVYPPLLPAFDGRVSSVDQENF